ncbi:MAG TPA: arginine deiminase-related protein [Alphaproteobacteria bacterium]|nr:arginine deiminase-related protein [Alphaproteobacteria bacterium]
MTKQKILMCAPDFFGVDYVINPWMNEGLHKTNSLHARSQWANLKRFLEQHAELKFVEPQKGLPDMVFTANAGMVLGSTVIVSRFHSEQRRGEESPFKKWFEANGFTIAPWPTDIEFEGAGDALFDRGKNFVWTGHGFRSSEKAAGVIESIFKRQAVQVKLVDPRWYHLDTCLCPLPDGYVMYYPAAFDEASQKKIADHVPEEKRIVIGEEDALKFACNAVDVDGIIILNDASTELQDRLRRIGLTPIITSLAEFMKSGGSAKCLTLKLIES